MMSGRKSEDSHLADGGQNTSRKVTSPEKKTSPSLYVSESSYSNEFSPNSAQTDKEDDSDSEADFEDIDPIDSPSLLRIKKAQDALWNYTDDHGKMLWLIFMIVALLLYFAYFIYAMIYHFGDEGSIRLLWMTSVVVFFFTIHFIMKCCGDKIRTVVAPCWEKIEPHGKTINWVLLGLVLLFIMIFILVDVLYVTKNYYNLVSVSGVCFYVVIFFIFSHSPAYISWRAVLWGLALQFLCAIIILRTSWGYSIFKWLGDRIETFLSHADYGSTFLFGDLYVLHFVAFRVLPIIVYFSAVISVLFYLGWMQKVIWSIAWVMQMCMGTSAGESFNAAGNIFIGMGEGPFMIRPLLPHMTPSELHAIMTSGFATIAGSVLGAYINFGAPTNHLLSASVMSAPAGLALSKLLYPETKKSKTTTKAVKCIAPSSDQNIIQALSSGASASIIVVASIAANLIAFISVLHFINSALTWFGRRVDTIGIYPPEHDDITLEWLLSYIMWPLAVVMGIEIRDCRQVAKLLGIKSIISEFLAYQILGEIIDNTAYYEKAVARNYSTFVEGTGLWVMDGVDIINVTTAPPGKITLNGTNVYFNNGILTKRSQVITTYALCGFANFGAMGTMLGVLGSLVPNRKRDLSRLVLRAMIAGNVACFMTAAIAAIFYQGEY